MSLHLLALLGLVLTSFLIPAESSIGMSKRGVLSKVMPHFSKCAEEYMLTTREKMQLVDNRVGATTPNKVKIDSHNRFNANQVYGALKQLYNNRDTVDRMHAIVTSCAGQGERNGLEDCDLAWYIAECIKQRMAGGGLMGFK